MTVNNSKSVYIKLYRLIWSPSCYIITSILQVQKQHRRCNANTLSLFLYTPHRKKRWFPQNKSGKYRSNGTVNNSVAMDEAHPSESERRPKPHRWEGDTKQSTFNQTHPESRGAKAERKWGRRCRQSTLCLHSLGAPDRVDWLLQTQTQSQGPIRPCQGPKTDFAPRPAETKQNKSSQIDDKDAVFNFFSQIHSNQRKLWIYWVLLWLF